MAKNLGEFLQLTHNNNNNNPEQEVEKKDVLEATAGISPGKNRNKSDSGEICEVSTTAEDNAIKHQCSPTIETIESEVIDVENNDESTDKSKKKELLKSEPQVKKCNACNPFFKVIICDYHGIVGSEVRLAHCRLFLCS